MVLLKFAFVAAVCLATSWQDRQPRPVVLPELPSPPPVTPVQTTRPLPAAAPMPANIEATSFAVHNGTVYLKVGDMVVPMVGTTGCFTPKELLKTGDPRLHFERDLAVPPPPPEPAKR